MTQHDARSLRPAMRITKTVGTEPPKRPHAEGRSETKRTPWRPARVHRVRVTRVHGGRKAKRRAEPLMDSKVAPCWDPVPELAKSKLRKRREPRTPSHPTANSMNGLNGKRTGIHGFHPLNYRFPLDVPLRQLWDKPLHSYLSISRSRMELRFTSKWRDFCERKLAMAAGSGVEAPSKTRASLQSVSQIVRASCVLKQLGWCEQKEKNLSC